MKTQFIFRDVPAPFWPAGLAPYAAGINHPTYLRATLREAYRVASHLERLSRRVGDRCDQADSSRGYWIASEGRIGSP